MAALVETESSLFTRLQAPGSLSASAFLLSYTNKKNTIKQTRIKVNYARLSFCNCIHTL